jgi:lipopolysaccharide transport system ATP-binding protein
MTDTVISVEQLGKKYQITHQAGRSRYKSLGETMTLKARDVLNVWRFLNGNNGAGKATREEFWALKDVSFEVKRGEVLGIIGRNGAGKSTLLKILSRITEPSRGRVRIRGRVASLLEVGTGFHPELTGRENIYLNGAILGMSKAEIKRKFDEIVAFSEVEKFLDTPVKRFSSGMYVRLAFAVAAHLEPEILIVDEVLAVGDTSFQSKCLGKMQDVSAGGRTVLFVSHNITAILQLCTRGLLMKSGTLSLEGPIVDVANAYFGDAINSSSGEFDLASHPARSSRSRPIIRRIRLYGGDGIPTRQLTPDEQCYVELDYESPDMVKSPRWAIAIEDGVGRRIMTFASYFYDNFAPPLFGAGTIRCTIGALCLGAGQYLLSVSVGDALSGLIDSADGVAQFEVRWNNNYGNGEQYNPVYGPVLRNSQWTVHRN